MIAYNKIIASLLVVGGFATWLSCVHYLGSAWMVFAVGSASFFIVACFLPELPKVTFLSRRSALGLVGLFVWLAVSDLLKNSSMVFTTIKNPIPRSTMDMGLPIILGVASYWLSVFLIRGFRARPEYQNNEGEQAVDGNPH